MKSIIAFYTKAKAHLQLSDFYDACAQVRRGGIGRLNRTTFRRSTLLLPMVLGASLNLEKVHFVVRWA